MGNKFIMNDNCDNTENIKWLIIEKENKERVVELLDNTNDYAYCNDIKRIGQKYGSLYEASLNGEVISAKKEIKNLKICKWLSILAASNVIAIYPISFSLGYNNGELPFFGMAYLAGTLVSIGTCFDLEQAKLESKGIDILQEKVSNLLEKEKTVKQKVKEIKSLIKLDFIGSSASIASAIMISQSNLDFLGASLSANLFACLGGFLLNKALYNYNDLKAMPKDEENYNVTEKELEMFNREIIRNQRKR